MAIGGLLLLPSLSFGRLLLFGPAGLVCGSNAGCFSFVAFVVGFYLCFLSFSFLVLILFSLFRFGQGLGVGVLLLPFLNILT